MVEHPTRLLRRIAPNPDQLQVILGSLVGRGRLVGVARERRLRIALPASRANYVLWKYDRLQPFTLNSPRREGENLAFETVAHPLFDDIAALFEDLPLRTSAVDDAALRLLRPLGVAVLLADLGRLQLRGAGLTTSFSQRDAIDEAVARRPMRRVAVYSLGAREPARGRLPLAG